MNKHRDYIATRTHRPEVEDYSGVIVALLAAFAMGFISCLVTIGLALS